MRLIRCALRSTHFVLSRRPRVLRASYNNSKPETIQIYSLVDGPNMQLCGKSLAASVPSDTREVKKAQRRPSKAERKAIVEAFVNKYRSLNAGKFPSASVARREVGGSYYVIRSIVQELEYKYKKSSTGRKDETSAGKDTMRENNEFMEMEQVQSSHTTLHSGLPKDTKTWDESLVAKGTMKIDNVFPDDASLSSSELRPHAESCKDGQSETETLLVRAIAEDNEISTADEMIFAERSVEVRKSDAHITDGVLLGNQDDNKKKLLHEGQEVFRSQITVDSSVSDVKTGQSSLEMPKGKEGQQTPDLVEEPMNDKGGTSPSMSGDSTRAKPIVVLHSHPEKPEGNIEEETAAQDMLKSDGLELRTVERQSPNLEKSTRDAERQAKSSVWSNLKSLASGIMGLWRKF